MTIAFILYFLIVLGIGIFFFATSKGSGEKDYFLGNRSMGPWVTAMSAQASDMSGWLLMGFPGSIIAFGLGKAWIGIGLALGTIANWIFVARRLRRFTKASNDAITLPQYLTNRFATTNPALKVICAIIFLISFTVYVASAFNAGAAVFGTVIPWFANHQMLAMLLFAVLVLAYTFLGGYKAVCWTDFFQGILMLIALLATPIFMVTFGNFDASYATAFAEGVAPFGNNPFTASWTDIVSGLGWGLGYFGMPHILVRFMGIKSSKLIKKSATVAIVWLVLTLGAAIVIAWLGRTYLLKDGSALAQMLLPAGSQSRVFIEVVLNIFPGFIAGLMLSAIIAAAMSTADSQLLVASSSFTSDLYNPIFRKNKAGDKEMLWVGRLVVAIVTLIGFAIAASGLGKADSWASNIMAMVENAWGLFGAAFGPVVILSLFWKRLTYKGAVAGIIGGAVVDIAWLILFTSTVTDAVIVNTQVYEIVPGFIAGAICTVIFTLLDKKPSDEVVAIFEKATDNSIDD
ncbi:MAG: sodium/proline symporter [Ruminococcaceae bacterium]|nr:sodium/proline symporter [Oscillospiraceae bacterium]